MKKEPALKIVFCSNFMNHHQLYFSKSLINQGVDFRFITAMPIGAERIAGGWKDLNTKFDWIVRIYESEEQLKIAKKLIDEADLVIAGSFPIKLIRKRILKNKLVIITEWNSENAAKKLLQLYYALQGVNGYEIPFEGVCSVAPIMK